MNWIAPLCLLALSVSASAQSSLTLLVRDAETSAPIPGVQLTVGEAVGAADAFGAAELVGVEPGRLRVQATYVGYVSLDTTLLVAESEADIVVLSLQPDVEALEEILVEAETINDAVLRRRGFFERRDQRTGVFLTRQQLDQRGASQFADVFRSVPGVRVQSQAGVTSLVSSRRRGCLMAIYIDGTEATYLSRNVNALPYDDIAAVEVYRGPAEVPIEYTQTKSQETCGAVLVWTRIVASTR